jgi:hypothetical protein
MIIQAISNYLDKHSTEHGIEHTNHTHHIRIFKTHLRIELSYDTHLHIAQDHNTIIITTIQPPHEGPYSHTTLDLADPELFPKILKTIQTAWTK